MILFKRCSSTPWFVVIRHPSCNSSGACTGFMAGTVSPFSPQATVSTITELPQSNSVAAQLNRIGPSFFLRFPTKNCGVSACSDRNPAPEITVSEGPSCIFVGPLETASKETLEALYRQARDSYYSGRPLIVDDMFDRVELKLRSYGSKSVVKYPRCSLRRQLTYADAEEDPSQVLALASVWALLLAFGSFTFLIPTIYTISLAYWDAVNSRLSYNSTSSALEFLAMVKGVLFMALGSAIGYPLASASVGALKGLWRNDLVALKGACPNCGEEVFAFVMTDKPNQAPHRADCHVCECSLEFHSKVEHSISRPSRRWVYGRIYLVRRRGSRLGRWM